jgi:hypothetical protein
VPGRPGPGDELNSVGEASADAKLFVEDDHPQRRKRVKSARRGSWVRDRVMALLEGRSEPRSHCAHCNLLVLGTVQIVVNVQNAALNCQSSVCNTRRSGPWLRPEDGAARATPHNAHAC